MLNTEAELPCCRCTAPEAVKIPVFVGSEKSGIWISVLIRENERLIYHEGRSKAETIIIEKTDTDK